MAVELRPCPECLKNNTPNKAAKPVQPHCPGGCHWWYCAIHKIIFDRTDRKMAAPR